MKHRILKSLAVAVLSAALLPIGASAEQPTCSADSYVTRSLSGSASTGLPAGAQLMLRFVNLSDSHILDDEGSPVITGNYLESALEPAIGNNAAQRLQEEYTDEVLNAMIKTINVCNDQSPLSLMIATGDLTDNMTLNETRRYIDNLDGVSGADTAYEANCGYTTHDSQGAPKAGAGPCTPEMAALFAGPTGKLVADSQAPTPDPDDATYAFTPTRSARQIAETNAAAIASGSHFTAPGLPESLRCNEGAVGCGNVGVDIPHYAVFGNHDAAVRGTVTFQQPFQAGAAAVGRYFIESQREFINEWFYTTDLPGPKGHGFNFAGVRLNDADDRNDGYYAFDANGVRMIVLNTIYDGVLKTTHREGQTNSDTGGIVTGNEATNPIGLEQGAMSGAQFEWLRQELTAAAAAGKPVLALSHHPDRSFNDRRLGGRAPNVDEGGVTSVQIDELLGKSTFDGNVNTLVGWIAGHTHENVVEPCAPGTCTIGTSGAQPTGIGHGFWRIETSSLIDYPQEGRIVELYSLPSGGYALRSTMISPDPSDPTSNLSHDLSIAEAECKISDYIGGPLSSGPYSPERAQAVLDGAGEAAVQGNFCQGEASLAFAAGEAGDRDVILLP